MPGGGGDSTTLCPFLGLKSAYNKQLANYKQLAACRLSRLVINGRTLVSSIPNINFDSTLGCVDTILPIGWQRIHIDYAGVPEQTIRSVTFSYVVLCLAFSCVLQDCHSKAKIRLIEKIELTLAEVHGFVFAQLFIIQQLFLPSAFWSCEFISLVYLHLAKTYLPVTDCLVLPAAFSSSSSFLLPR